jgi:Zn-dependent peptidase ImmA (M78 family)
MDYVLREAQSLMKEFGTSNPRELADYLDIEIIWYPLSKLKGIYINLKNFKFAVINSNLNIEEQKYTLLHEIAHARLHPDNNYFAINENRLILTSKFECQADFFASALLLQETPEEYRSKVASNLLSKIPASYLKRMI